MNDEDIRRYTFETLPKEDRSDWERVLAMTEEEIEENARNDEDNLPLTDEVWEKTVRLSLPRVLIHMSLDREIADYFDVGNEGYQARINAALEAYVAKHRRKASPCSTEPKRS